MKRPARLYRAILIDPEQRSIEEIRTDASLDSIYALIETQTLDSFRLAEFQIDAREETSFDYAWVSDSALTSGPVHAFLLPIQKDPIGGRCLIIGSDERGKTSSANFPLAVLHRDVTWLGLIKPEVVWDQTEIGARAIVTYERVRTS